MNKPSQLRLVHAVSAAPTRWPTTRRRRRRYAMRVVLIMLGTFAGVAYAAAHGEVAASVALVAAAWVFGYRAGDRRR